MRASGGWTDTDKATYCWWLDSKNPPRMRKLYTAPVAAQAQPLDIQPIEITDSMALAFHNAITDGSVGQEDVDDIKTGLRAVFANIFDMRPQAQQPVSDTDGVPDDSDDYINELVQQYGYAHPISIAARLEQWISRHGGCDAGTLVMGEAMRALRQLSGNAEEAEDAARYRWLRDRNDWHAEPRLDEEDGTIWKLTFYTPAPIIDPADDDNLDTALIAAMLADASGCRPQQPKIVKSWSVQLSGNSGELGKHNLSTSAGGRAYVAEYFSKRLGRHDFTRYINDILAADFACALAQHLSQQDADKVDAERWRAYRAAAAGEDDEFLERVHSHLSSLGLRDQLGPTEDQIDAAIDAARKEQT